MQDALVMGASRGIGFGFVQHLLNQGSIAQVYATYRKVESAAPLLALAQQYGDRLTCIELEITDEDQIIQCLQQVAAGLKASDRQLGWVINCVGMLHQGDLQPEKSLRQINKIGRAHV